MLPRKFTRGFALTVMPKSPASGVYCFCCSPSSCAVAVNAAIRSNRIGVYIRFMAYCLKIVGRFCCTGSLKIGLVDVVVGQSEVNRIAVIQGIGHGYEFAVDIHGLAGYE